MKFIENTLQSQDAIETCIKTYGSSAEHNFWWYEYCRLPKKRNIFVKWPDGRGLLTRENNKIYTVIDEPLAPTEERSSRLIEYTNFVLRKKAKKVIVELGESTRRTLLENLPKKISAKKVAHVFSWPIMDIETFDPALPGRRFKHIRQAIKKFYKYYTVEIKSAEAVPKELLHDLVRRWCKNRTVGDTAHAQKYHACIQNKFLGTANARVFFANNTAVGLNAGWYIPNSNRYYGAIGLHDYSDSDLGMVLYAEDLEWMKKENIKEADMGGGKDTLNIFKKQFGPAMWYTTRVFSLVFTPSM